VLRHAARQVRPDVLSFSTSSGGFATQFAAEARVPRHGSAGGGSDWCRSLLNDL